jgi:hypothetical protein
MLVDATRVGRFCYAYKVHERCQLESNHLHNKLAARVAVFLMRDFGDDEPALVTSARKLTSCCEQQHPAFESRARFCSTRGRRIDM